MIVKLGLVVIKPELIFDELVVVGCEEDEMVEAVEVVEVVDVVEIVEVFIVKITSE